MSNENQNRPDAAAIAKEIRAQEAAEKAAKEAEEKKKTGQGCLILIVIIVVIGVVGSFWSSSGSESGSAGNSTQSRSSSENVVRLPGGDTITSARATVMCRDQIRKQLVSPSSARFPGVFSDRYTQPLKTGNAWRQLLHVDSQNAFGAMLPSSWNCVIDGDTGMITVTQR